MAEVALPIEIIAKNERRRRKVTFRLCNVNVCYFFIANLDKSFANDFQ